MSHDEPTPDPHLDPNAGYERRDVNVPVLTAVSIITIIFLVTTFFVMDSYYRKTVEQLRDKAVRPNAELQKLRATEEEILTTYGKVEEGVYRIPVSRAMKLVAQEQRERSRQE